MIRRSLFVISASTALLAAISAGPLPAAADVETDVATDVAKTRYRIATIDGVDVFYREAGRADAPAVLLLHGFPTSSHMYRDLIGELAADYHVIAPDYPGFGYSAAPDRAVFAYTFENYAALLHELTRQLALEGYALYVMDYGAPVGFRLVAANPDAVTALIVQNGNAYEAGIAEFWDPIKAYWKTGGAAEREALRAFTEIEATRWQYMHGVPDASLVSPDAVTVDQAFLDRPGNGEIQLDLFYDYRTNIPLYAEWQAYFRERKPPTLVIWGRNDQIFVAAGAESYTHDNPNAEVHLLDTGHFALETHGPEIATLLREFLGRTVVR